jgi:hypothetical protein
MVRWRNLVIRWTLGVLPTAIFVVGVWWPGYLPTFMTVDAALGIVLASLGAVVLLFALGAWNWGVPKPS